MIDSRLSSQLVLTQELQQAKVRCLFAVAFISIFLMITINFSKYQEIFDSVEIFKVSIILVSIIWSSFQILLFKFYKNIKPSTGRILFGQIVDVSVISVILSTGAVATFFFGTFLWIILGNGMRFGRGMLVTCQILSLIAFGISVAVTPYWQQHFESAISYIIILILIPVYFGILVKRLAEIRDELIQTEKAQVDLLKQMDNLKTTFFANISHEFRTPIALTLGSLDMLERNPAEMVSQIPIVRRNQNRLLQLINQILDLEKIEQGGLELKLAPIGNLDHFLKIRAEQFQSMAVKKSLELKVELFANLAPGEIYFDPDHLDKVIFNLLSNAFKFTNQGQITISSKRKNESVEIAVQDSGLGIKEDQLPFIFDRFRQATGSESKDYAGTGIGLSLVQEIVKLHSGEIVLSSQYGVGSTFTVILPLGKSHLSENQISPSLFVEDESQKRQIDFINEGLSDVKGIETHKKWNEECLLHFDKSKKTILYVDDNFDLRCYLINLLGTSYNLLLAWDGLAALEILDHHVPDLILSDLMMPKLDGAGLIRRIRENPDLRDIPFVILTAKATENTKFDLLDAGADDFLFKPFSREELLVRVRNLLILREKTTAAQNQLLEAKKIQRSLLPPETVDLPHATVQVLYQPCETLSGDFYDILTFENILLVYIADVTSHGTSAAQITYLIKSTLKSVFESNPEASVSMILKLFSKKYIDFNLDYGVAIQIFKYETGSHSVTYSSSNSPTALLKSREIFKGLPLEKNPLIDAKFFNESKSNFNEEKLILEKGDSIFCFTDGCFELIQSNGQAYTDSHFSRDLQKVSTSPEWRDEIFNKLKAINGKANFPDDITILRLSRK